MRAATNSSTVRASLALLALALGGACRIQGTFSCALDEHCGDGGRCEPAGYCSFADGECAEGRRYDDLAGDDLAGLCVGPGPAPTGCAAGYTATISGSSSRYRVALQPAAWLEAQRDCADDGGGGSHLVVVGSEVERSGVRTLVGDDAWIGYSDRVVEGTFRWVTAAAPTIEPWDSGEPDESDGTEDCVEQKRVQSTWQTQPCTELIAYLCECDGVASNLSSY